MKIPRTPVDGRASSKGKRATTPSVDRPGWAATPWEHGDVVDLWVPHIAAPQGSHRQGFGKSVRETNPKTEPYRQAVADACEKWLDDWVWTPLDGPLGMRVVFYMPPPPKSDPGRRYPHIAPDLDKLLRSTCDGITRGRIWKDDARLVEVTALKVHAETLEKTGVDIRIWEMS